MTRVEAVTREFRPEDLPYLERLGGGSNVALLGDFAAGEDGAGRAVPDPYGASEPVYEETMRELERARQDAGLWREETDRERARIANMQADAEHTERELTRLRVEREQARRPWWWRLIGR